MSATYNALGQPRTINFGNGVSQRRYYGGLDTTLYNVSFGKMRQLCVAQTSLGECADDAAPGRGGTWTTLFNAVYGYDAVGNITAIDERTPNLGEINWYQYDALDRLTEWQKVTNWSPLVTATQESYRYNAIGNLTGRYGVSATGAITYPAAGSPRPHAATGAANGNSYIYDGVGNMTVRREMSGSQAFTYTQGWTIDNRLASVTKTDVAGTVLAVTKYAYDGDGARVRKEDPDGIVLYVGATEAVIGAAGTATAEYFDDVSGTTPSSFYATRAEGVEAGLTRSFTDTPLAGMGATPWAVRWQLWLAVPATDTYTFAVYADDGFAFNGNGLVFSNGTTRAPVTTEATSGLVMTPGNVYNFVLAYFNYTTATVGNIQLLWRRSGGALEIVPREAIHARGRKDYYSFGGAAVAVKEGVMSSATRTLTYLHGDHLGSASLTTNISGTVVSQQRYKPYGEVRWSSGAGMPTDFTFTSQRAGPANYVGSLTDYVARFYSPALGRFISADTIVPNPDGPQLLNRYTYVRNSPLSRVDPGGNCDVSADKAKDPCWQRLSDIEKWFPNVTIQGDAYDIVDLNALLSGLEMMRDYFGSQQALYMAIGKVAVLDPNSRRFSTRNPACGSSATSGGCTVSGLGITAISFRRKDIQTVVHELAHAYDFNVGYHGDRWFQGMLKGGSSTTYGNTGGPVEDFAEAVAWAVFSDARGSGLTARFAEDWGYAQPSKDRRDSAFAVKQYVQRIAGLVVSPSSTPSPLNSPLVSPLPTPSVRP